MIKHVLAELAPIRARRAELAQRPGIVDEVLADGNARARARGRGDDGARCARR